MPQFSRVVLLVCAAILTGGIDGFLRRNFADATIRVGKCPDAPQFQNFSVNAFEGEWFLGHQLAPKFSPCTTFLFNVTSTNNFKVKTVTRTEVWKAVEVQGKTFTPNVAEPAVMKWSWDLFPTFVDQVTVVDTDYSSYAALFFCTDVGLLHHRSGVVFTRTENDLPAVYIKRAQKVLSQLFPHASGTRVEMCKFDRYGFPRNETKISSYSLDEFMNQATKAFHVLVGFGR